MKTNYDKRGIQTCYIDSLESKHPGYMHKLFRLACKNIGFNESFKFYADEMNSVALKMDKKQL